MTNESTTRSGRRRTLGALGWLAAGFLLAVLLLVDPLGLHPLDEWVAGLGSAPEIAGADAGDAQLWTCGMHPNVIQNEPGQCPICQMDLVPLRATGEHAGHAHEAAAHPEAAQLWTCPEHPFIEESEPGECPIDGRELVAAEPGPAKDSMGMDYAPVYADEVGEASGQGAVVRINPAMVQNMNVQSVPVTRRDLEHRIRTVGYLEYDQERMVSVTTKYSGWVERVYVNYVGEPVKKGQPLFEVYSPELVQTQQELLSALSFARRMEQAPGESRRRAQDLVAAARTRMGYWDISPRQIDELERSGEVLRTLTVVAPASGLIMKRLPGLEGMAVQPGMEIFHIADLSSIWLSVEVFEDQVAWIREGTPAAVSFTYFPGETFRGTVRFIEPEFSETTRTLRAKLEVPNPGGRLRAGMFATVIFKPPAVEQALTVPALSILRTGRRNVVVVDLGEGRFAPREVVLGHEGEGYLEVLAGLEEGEMVVTSAQFLLDSESNLQEAIQKMIAQARGRTEPGEG